MAKKNPCRMPNILDIQYAREHSMSDLIIANLRGLYEVKTGKTLNSFEEYTTELVPFKNRMLAESTQEIVDILNCAKKDPVATAIQLLKSNFTNAEIRELTNVLYTQFTMVVDAMIKRDGDIVEWLTEKHNKNEYVSRQDIIRKIGANKIEISLLYGIKEAFNNPNRKDFYQNPLLAKMLEGGSDYFTTFLWMAKDEIAKREGVSFGKKIKFEVEFKNNETLEADFKIEESIKEGWMKEINKDNPFKTIGAEVRSYLGRLRMYEPERALRRNAQGQIVQAKIPIKSKNGFIRFHDPVQLHKFLQTLLSGCRDQKHMLERIERAGRSDVNIQQIYIDLSNDPQLLGAFYRDFHKTTCLYSKIYSTYKNGVKHLVHSIIKNNINKFSYYHYSNSLTPKSNLDNTIFRVDNETNTIVVHGQKWQVFKSYITDSLSGNSLATMQINVDVPVGVLDAERSHLISSGVKDFLNTINDALALGMTSSNIDDLIRNKVALKSVLLDLYELNNRDTRIQDGMAFDKMSSIYKDRISGILKTIREADTTSSKSVRIGKNGKSSTYFTDIVSCKVANNIDTVKSFAKDAQEYLSMDDEAEQKAGLERVVKNLKAWIMDTWGVSSEYYNKEKDMFYNKWIDDLYKTNVESLTDPDSFIYHFNYDRTMLFDGINAEDFSAEFDLKTFITNYFSETLDADRGYARYPMFTTGDSLALKFFNAKKFGYKGVINEFVAVAYQEVARMKIEKTVAKELTNKGYDVKGITPSADKSVELTGNFVYLKCLNNYKSELQDALNQGTFSDKVAEILQEELFKEFKTEFWDKVKDYKSFTPSEDGTLFKEFGNMYSLNPAFIEENNGTNGLLMYYLNTKLAYTMQFQFLGANPATYGLSTAMQKRFKAWNAPGSSMDVWATDYNNQPYRRVENGVPVEEKVWYFMDMKRNAEETDPGFMSTIAERFGLEILRAKGETNITREKAIEAGKQDPRYKKYLSNDSTDGQGFRTIESYRRVMGMAHQWTIAMDNAYNKLQEFRMAAWNRASQELFNKSFEDCSTQEQEEARLNATLTVQEIDQLDDLDVVFQPIKPHTATVEKVYTESGDVLLIPVEHKYAEALIIPELFAKGSFRKHLGVQMELNNIDLAASEQCVKVGSFGAADLRNSTPETFKADISKAYTHTISYADYTIQTNVPEHINALQLFGTQLRKHVFDAINLLQSYKLGDVKSVNVHGNNLTLDGENGGKHFLKFYNALICENMNTDLKDLTAKISNAVNLSDLLTELKGNDVNSSINDLIKYSLDENNEFINPLCEPTTAYDVESTFTSIFKREVNKQHINGGSCVQVSDIGVNGFGHELQVHTEIAADGFSNITYVDCAMAFDLSWTDAQGNKVALKFSDYCLEDGSLRSAVDPNRAVKDNELSKLEKEFPGILDLVAYRIPTEREYSIINLKVKRFFPKIMGAIIMVPSQYTTVAGFDFDIDKLYYFRKEFKQKEELSPKIIDQIWNKIYNIHKDEEDYWDTSRSSDIYKALKKAKEEAVEKYNETIGETDPSVTTSFGSILAEALKGVDLGESEITEAVENSFEFDPSKKRLHTFWEAAGLTESTGKTASEYFTEYLNQHRTEYLEFDFYDYSKDVSENSVVARNNALIECIQSRLTDPATFNARYTPGGFTNAIVDADILKSILYSDNIPKETLKRVIGKESIDSITDAENFVKNAEKEDLVALDVNKDVTNVLTTCDYNTRNRVASKVIGIMANHNTNAVYSKAMNRLALRSPIKIFGYVLQELNGENDTNGTHRDYMLTLAELLASSVDAVKTPVLNFLNINSYTASTAAFLARLGLSTEEIGLFLNQPIIRKVCEYAANNEVSITTAINRIAGEREGYSLSLPTEYNGSKINKVDLFNGLKLKDSELKGNANQANILKAFQSISAQAQALSDFIGKTKYTAANSIENSIGGLLALVYDNKAANEKESPINKYLIMDFGTFDDQALNEALNKEEVYSPISSDINTRTLEYMQTQEYKDLLDKTPFAFEQMVHDAVNAYIKKLSKYFPYLTPHYQAIYDTVFNNIAFGTMDKDIFDAINYQFPVYALNCFEGSSFSPDIDSSVLDGNNKFYYTVTFPEELRSFLTERAILKTVSNKEEEYKAIKLKYSWLSNVPLDAVLDNSLLDNMQIEEWVSQEQTFYVDDNGIRYSISLEENSQFNQEVKDNLTSAWEDLLGDKDTNVIDPKNSLAHALFMYNFFIRGYEVGNNAFSNITPDSIKKTLFVTPDMSYYDFYNQLIKGNHPFGMGFISRFIPLFYSNNIYNNKLVKNLYGFNIKDGYFKSGENYPSGHVSMTKGEVTITFDNNGNYGDLLLPASKRALPKGTRAVVNAFKVKNRDGSYRLFVLKPASNTGGYNFSDPQYNIRSTSASVSYVEIPVKGIKGTVADYSRGGFSFTTTNDNIDVNGENSYTYEGYVEEDGAELIALPRTSEEVSAEAHDLINKAYENAKDNNYCIHK